MKITPIQTDNAILAELGARLARQRIDLQLTQEQLAQQAGVSKRTIERIEAGDSTQSANLIRIFRVLELTHSLDQLIPETVIRPMDLLKHKDKPRQRASANRVDDKPADKWTWKE